MAGSRVKSGRTRCCSRRAAKPPRWRAISLVVTKMTNPWQPSPDEIREWAYTVGAMEPCQDWDLALLWSCHEKALLDCASDDACPNRIYMLGILYLVVGDAVRNDFRTRPQPIIEGFLDRGDEY